MAEIALVQELKVKILNALNLTDMTPEEIDAGQPLFGSGLGLDSIDALELIVLMEKDYGIKIKDPAEAKTIFVSVNNMADYIAEHRTK